MTARRTSALSLAGILGLGALAGCGSSDDGAPAAAPAAVSTEGPTELATPETSAGPLTKAQLPPPTALGTKWTAYVQPGGGESAVVGNGSSAQRRDISEVMDGLTPIGCPDAAVEIALPRPTYALEGSYRGPNGAPGVSLVLQFADSSAATAFLDAFGAQIDACPAPAATPPGDDPLALGFERLPTGAATVAALRRETGLGSDPNRYLVVAVAAGDRVGLAYVGGAGAADRTRVATGLRTSIAR